MRLDEDPNENILAEPEEISPFLSNQAITVDIGAGVTAMLLKKQMKKQRNIYTRSTRGATSLFKLVGASRKNWYESRGLGKWSVDELNIIERKATKLGATAATAHSKVSSFGKYASTFRRTSKFLGVGALFSIGFEATKGIFSITDSYRHSSSALGEALASGYDDAKYYDSRMAMTQRQRALQAIHASSLGTRAAFGNEASYLHM